MSSFPLNIIIILAFVACISCNKLTYDSNVLIPKADSVSPKGGPHGGGEILEITGSNLQSVKEILIGEVPCTITSLQSNLAKCQTQSGSVGWHQVNFKLLNQKLVSSDLKFARGALVLGQTSFSVDNGHPTTGFAYIRAVATDGSRLIASDWERKRIFIWNSIPATTNISPNVVLDGYFNSTEGACTDGTRLIISDTSDHRVLVWNHLPTYDNQPPDYVLGQSDLTSKLANRGGTASAATLNGPGSVWCDTNHIAVADASNNRVLIWNTAISQNGQNADAVLGQIDFTSVLANKGGSVDLSTLRGPKGVHFDGAFFSVADRANNRVLIYNGWPATNASAVRVLGQTSASGSSAANTAARLRNPNSVISDGSFIYVADTGNHRVLGWDMTAAGGPLSWAHGRTSDILLGQPSFTSMIANNGGVSGSTMHTPYQVSKLGSQLMVVDSQNSRILMWNTPLTTQSSANSVLGQSDLTKSTYRAGHYSQRTMFIPSSATPVPGGFSVLTYRASRFAHFHSLPFIHNPPIDSIHGQPTFLTGNKNYDGSTIINGYSYFNATDVNINSASGQLCISDMNLHRVLCWHSIPSSVNTPADFILGQTAANVSVQGSSAQGMSNPNSTCSVGNKIYVADSRNNRILGWNSIPSTHGTSADFVLGQSDFGASYVAANRGGTPGANTLNGPNFILCENGKLIVSDSGNHRVLVWNTLPSTSDVAADLVIGQPDFTSVSSGTSLSTFTNPRGMLLKNNKFYVADEANNRILIWDSFPSTNGQVASTLFGQKIAGENSPNQGLSVLDMDTLSEPRSITSFDDDRIAIVDKNNNRVLVLPNF